jgi:PAS domain-containing protein
MAPTQAEAVFRVVSTVLDSMTIGCCVFDAEDRTALWNNTMLVFFPEHAEHLHAGEPYRANLKRFYGHRLTAEEMPRIEQYIEAGVVRHQTQQRPFNFQHRGTWLRVASQPLPDRGRIRIWSRLGESASIDDGLPALSTLL